MARPRKNDADYFPHDKDMRNDPKVRAIRQRHGVEGYAIWNMLIETLTDCDDFKMQVDDVTMEILAGDFGVEQDVLNQVFQSFRRLKLISWEEETLFAPGLLKRMEPLLVDRQRKRDWAAKKTISEDAENQEDKKFPTSKTPQSKVKESKVKNTLKSIDKNAHANGEKNTPDSEPKKEKPIPPSGSPLPAQDGWRPVDIDAELLEIQTDDLCRERFFRQCQIPIDRYDVFVSNFALKVKTEKKPYSNRADFRAHFFNWSRTEYDHEQKQKNNGSPKLTFNTPDTIHEGLEFAQRFAAERAARKG